MRPRALRDLAVGLLAVGSLHGAPCPQDDEPEQPSYRLELPDGPAAKAWAGVGAITAPQTLPPTLSAACRRGAWAAPATWKLWAEWVQAEREETRPAQRAALCLLARAQGRSEDAWAHYARTGADPRWAAAITPLLLPGAPLGSEVLAGGVLAPLPDGVLLQPFLPPPSGKTPPGRIEWRTAKVRGLRVGEAVIDLMISVEDSGVQVDVIHVSGGPARLSVRIPEPPGHEIRLEYLDWMQLETLHEPIPVELLPGDEPHTLWGRMLETTQTLPTGRAASLPAPLREGGLFLALPAGDPDIPRLTAISASLGELLGVPVRLTRPDEPLGTWTGTVMNLANPDERPGRLAWLVSAIEAFLLPAR